MRDELVKVREKVKKDLPEPSPIVKGERRKVPAKRQMWTEEEAEELLRKAESFMETEDVEEGVGCQRRRSDMRSNSRRN